MRGLHWWITDEILPPYCEVYIELLKQGKSVAPEIQETINKYGQRI